MGLLSLFRFELGQPCSVISLSCLSAPAWLPWSVLRATSTQHTELVALSPVSAMATSLPSLLLLSCPPPPSPPCSSCSCNPPPTCCTCSACVCSPPGSCLPRSSQAGLSCPRSSCSQSLIRGEVCSGLHRRTSRGLCTHP